MKSFSTNLSALTSSYYRNMNNFPNTYKPIYFISFELISTFQEYLIRLWGEICEAEQIGGY